MSGVVASSILTGEDLSVPSKRPVTIGLIGLAVTILTVAAPGIWWTASLQAQVNTNTRHSEDAQKLGDRMTAVETELRLRGKQLDRIEDLIRSRR